jgi:hypothetical protein
MAVVVFDLTSFREIYPAFSDEVKFPDAALQDCFDTAAEIVGNDDSCLIPYDPEATPPVRARLQVLYALTCHIATMRYIWDDTQAGALTNATQGSVSAGFGVRVDDDSWWNSTKCGATAFMLLNRYKAGGAYFGAQYVHVNG